MEKRTLEQAESDYAAATKRAQYLCAWQGHDWHFKFGATVPGDGPAQLCDICKRCGALAYIRVKNHQPETLAAALKERGERWAEIRRLCTQANHKRPDGSDARVNAWSREGVCVLCARCHFRFVKSKTECRKKDTSA